MCTGLCDGCYGKGANMKAKRYVVVRYNGGPWRVIHNRKTDVSRFTTIGSKPLSCGLAMGICWELNVGRLAVLASPHISRHQ